MTSISTIIIPLIISVILFEGLIEKKPIYDIFCDGAKDGIKVTLKLFPTLIGVFVCINMFRNSGILIYIEKISKPLLEFFNLPSDIIPLMIIKPLSGSATLGIATDIMTKYGVDSRVGKIASTIMSSSETTFYVIAIYLNSIKAKKNKKIFIPSIIADITSIIVALILIK